MTVLPTQEGCKFTVVSTDDLVNSGDLSVTRAKATESDYEKQWRAYYIGDETYDLKPRSTRGEKTPYAYFFWYTGSELVSVKATIKLCRSDKLPKIALAFYGTPAAPKADFCGTSTKAACEIDADCIASGCSGQICQAKTEQSAITTCEMKDCYIAKNYGVGCLCRDKKCQWQ